MVDWINLGTNALWIMGSALALASLSYTSWEAALTGTPLRDQLSQDASQLRLALAGALVSLGLAGTSNTGLEIALWSLLALACTVQMGLTWRGKG
jgi:hypothetical protein